MMWLTVVGMIIVFLIVPIIQLVLCYRMYPSSKKSEFWKALDKAFDRLS